MGTNYHFFKFKFTEKSGNDIEHIIVKAPVLTENTQIISYLKVGLGFKFLAKRNLTAKSDREMRISTVHSNKIRKAQNEHLNTIVNLMQIS